MRNPEVINMINKSLANPCNLKCFINNDDELIVSPKLNAYFNHDDFQYIYEKLGNRVNHKLTIDFIEKNYDMNLLEKVVLL